MSLKISAPQPAESHQVLSPRGMNSAHTQAPCERCNKGPARGKINDKLMCGDCIAAVKAETTAKAEAEDSITPLSVPKRKEPVRPRSTTLESRPRGFSRSGKKPPPIFMDPGDRADRKAAMQRGPPKIEGCDLESGEIRQMEIDRFEKFVSGGSRVRSMTIAADSGRAITNGELKRLSESPRDSTSPLLTADDTWKPVSTRVDYSRPVILVETSADNCCQQCFAELPKYGLGFCMQCGALQDEKDDEMEEPVVTGGGGASGADGIEPDESSATNGDLGNGDLDADGGEINIDDIEIDLDDLNAMLDEVTLMGEDL